MKDLKHPAKPFFQNESDVDVTIHSNKESEEEDYHMVTGANRNYIPRQSEWLSPFFKLPKEIFKFFVPTNLVDDFTNLNKIPKNFCQLALKPPLQKKHLIVMSDASFTAAGYAIMIEDDPNQKLQSKRKTYAPIAFGSKTFNPTQTKMSIFAKKFLSIYFAFFEFGHLM